MNKVIKQIKETKITAEQTAIWYLGQEGFLFGHDGKFLLIDPYLSDYVDKNCCRFVEWKRLYPAPVDAADLDFVDHVLLTHTHYDHADPYTLKALTDANAKAKFICPAPTAAVISSYGIEESRIIPAYADTEIAAEGFTITPVPAAHEVLHANEQGNYCELGYIVDDGAGRFFHAGDCCPYDGLEKRLTDIDIAFLPVNGRDYYRNGEDIIGNFNADEAVRLVNRIGAGMFVPMHHDLYTVNGIKPHLVAEAAEKLDFGRRFHNFAVGERYIFAK